MVNDNKNINTLVDDSDDDPTAELEILSEAMLRSSADENFSADDTGTYQIQKLELADETSTEKIRDLQADLSSRTQSVGRLQRDIEQLRSKWSGLQKEISAREKQTKKITIQLADAQRKVAESKETLSQRDDKIKSLNAHADDFKKQAKAVAQEISQFQSDAKASKSQLTKFKNRLAEKDGQIHALTKGIESKQEAQHRSEEIETRQGKEIQGLQKQLKDSQSDLVDLCEHVDTGQQRVNCPDRKRDIREIRVHGVLGNEETGHVHVTYTSRHAESHAKTLSRKLTVPEQESSGCKFRTKNKAVK